MNCLNLRRFLLVRCFLGQSLPSSSVLPCIIQPDVFSFNTAIASCVKSGDWRRSLDLLAGMKVEGMTPDILSYNGAIAACAKGGQWRIGLELLAKVSLYMLPSFIFLSTSAVDLCKCIAVMFC